MKYWNAAFLERLLIVQDTDLKIRKLGNQIQVYYQRSKEEDTELTRLKLDIAQIDETIEATESQNQMYSTTLEDIRTAIKGLLTTKSGVPKPRTRSSTEALKIEEEKLAALVEETAEQLGTLRVERERLIEKAGERSRLLEKSQEGPEAEIRKLQTQINKLESRRESEIEGLPAMLLKHYDRLRSSRSGIGLTILRDGVCTVCRMQMPTAVISRMTKGERVPVCPACGRMVARIEIVELIQGKDDAAEARDTPKTAKKTKKKTAAASTKKTAAAKKKAGTKKAASKKVKTEKSAKKTVDSDAEPEAAVEKKKVSSKKTAEKKIATKKKSAETETVKKEAAKKSAPKAEPAKKSTSKKSAAKKTEKKVDIKNSDPKTGTEKDGEA